MNYYAVAMTFLMLPLTAIGQQTDSLKCTGKEVIYGAELTFVMEDTNKLGRIPAHLLIEGRRVREFICTQSPPCPTCIGKELFHCTNTNDDLPYMYIWEDDKQEKIHAILGETPRYADMNCVWQTP